MTECQINVHAQQSPKSGVRTSEFWLMVASIIGSVLVTICGADDTGIAEPVRDAKPNYRS